MKIDIMVAIRQTIQFKMSFWCLISINLLFPIGVKSTKIIVKLLPHFSRTNFVFHLDSTH
jgi:hypothetical protein